MLLRDDSGNWFSLRQKKMETKVKTIFIPLLYETLIDCRSQKEINKIYEGSTRIGH